MPLSEFEKARRMTEKIDGFLTDREGWLLYQLARRVPSGCIVEIGSWQGKSTVWIGLGNQKGSRRKIFAIDPHTGSSEHQEAGKKVWTYQNFMDNIKRANVDGDITPVVDFSHKARAGFSERIGMLFIDGAHDYDSVKKDYDLWSPLVVDGGFIVFHDTQWEGVKKVCDTVFEKDGFRRVYFQDTICYGIKTPAKSGLDTLRARAMVSLKNRFADVCGSSRSKTWKKFQKDTVKLKRALWALV